MSANEKDIQNSCCSGSHEQKLEVIQAETDCCSKENTDHGKQEASCCTAQETEERESSCCETGEVDDDKDAGQPDNPLQLVEYQIKGMDCPSCAATIEKGLQKKEGIQSVSVNYGTAKMAVGAENPALFDQIPQHVKKLGFDAHPLQTEREMETYKVEGMDCGSCAATIEKHLSNNAAVKEVRVNFSTGKLHVRHTTKPDEIIKEVQRSGFEAYLESGETPAAGKGNDRRHFPAATVSGTMLALGFIGSFTPLSAAWITAFYALAIAVGGWKPLRSAFYAVKSGSLDMNVLMASAALGAALIGEWFEGAMVVWLFAVGNALQNRSLERTRDSIRSLMNIAPAEALVKEGRQWIRKAVEEVSIGEVIVVKPGDRVPLDGEILSGASSLNQAPITGESLPVDKQEGDVVYAGTINESGSLEVRVTKRSEDTAIAKIIHLVEEAQEKKAPTQAFVDRFAGVYTPIVFILALLVMVIPPLITGGAWGEWLYKGISLLVVACPCALVISTPVAIVSAIGNAARHGVLIKGGTFLEKAGAIQVMAFDKTGTLTEGRPKVADVITLHGEKDELISIARTIEEYSAHPIAAAVSAYASERGISAVNGRDFRALPGKGAQADIDGTVYYAGNSKLFKELGVPLNELESQLKQLQSEGKTIVLIGTAEEISGIISVADSMREITVRLIQSLKQSGLKELVMLTGDNEGTARRIAAEAGVDRYFADLMPEDKTKAIEKLKHEGKQVAMVGDGINDAPALASSDLGIAMGGAGTDTAMETADVVLMADNLEKLPHTIRLSRKALTIIKQNVWFSLLTKLAALVLIFPGFLTLWMAVLSDTGAALIVILNSMRLLRHKA
ncbi:heavy metal translocating P-type ATPase [Halobacillus litoralis]|uniref:heavy metal translocating P-type ATPase n=1 Tax=Halobacillus litoralis TaxID=45668 RepID=UPI00136B6F8A|nr:heavy metal translocating P-type ATPase [Halobacillus litoralis]MYL36979.1 cadmium-translocating P-type ATPase [Halobacillus litoralis]